MDTQVQTYKLYEGRVYFLLDYSFFFSAGMNRSFGITHLDCRFLPSEELFGSSKSLHQLSTNEIFSSKPINLNGHYSVDSSISSGRAESRCSYLFIVDDGYGSQLGELIRAIGVGKG